MGRRGNEDEGEDLGIRHRREGEKGIQGRMMEGRGGR